MTKLYIIFIFLIHTLFINEVYSSIASMAKAFSISPELQAISSEFSTTIVNEDIGLGLSNEASGSSSSSIGRNGGSQVMDTSATVLGLANGYGCHCLFENDKLKQGAGKGHPKDIFDEKCRVLTKSYSCISIDDYEENHHENCTEPWLMDYNVPVVSLDMDPIARCDALNPDALVCELRACYVEANFLLEIVKITNLSLMFPDLLSYSHTAPGSEFDWKQDCPSTRQTKPVRKGYSCCGKYPGRTEFGIAEGKECCGNKLFFTITKECCDADTNEVRDIGDC